MKAQVLIVDDDDALRRALCDRIEHWGHHAETARTGEEARAILEKRGFDLVFLDLQMPGIGGMELLRQLRAKDYQGDIVVLTAYGSMEKAVEALQAGADDFLGKPADFALLRKVVERSLEKRAMRRANRALREEAKAGRGLILGPSPKLQEAVDLATRAAASNATILIRGESGSGKQILAEHIHANSERKDGPFVYVNCVAISEDLIESTLFGHEKGAFTGAVSRKEGRLEAANGGTAFLDEIGDISASLQTKLLHFLESGEFERVGGTQTLRVDCRVIAATNRELEAEIAAGRFREDLFYRLNVIGIPLPPLRERPEDIPVLAESFLRRFADELGRGELCFEDETLRRMVAYPWPGNVRQLRNAVERMAVLARGASLEAALLPPEILFPRAEAGERELDLPYKEALTEFKRKLLAHALQKHAGNQTRAAEELEIQRSYLNRLLKELEIES